MDRSEREINKIIEEVLQDCREDEIVYCNGNLKDKEEWEDYSKRYEIYNYFKNKKEKVDAERWNLAMESYKKYPCFGQKSKFQISEYIYYPYGDNNRIRIPADLLTNINAVREAVKRVDSILSEEDKKIIDAFYRVAGTMGNFCPIWRNPGAGGRKGKNDDNSKGQGNDHCWKKLAFGGIDKKECDNLVSRYNLDRDYNLLRRNMENLFMILPQKDNKKLNPKEVMQELYFQDYFDSNWKLRIDGNTNILMLKDKDKLINYIKITTILIVQRSYRISTGYMGNVFSGSDKEIIEKILNLLGLDGCKCIYSRKNN